MKKRVLTRASTDPDSLIELLATRLGLSANEARDIVAGGGVYVGGQRADKPRVVAIGDKITVFAGAAKADGPAPAVVHQDDWIAVVDKPAGLPSQAERSQSSGALDAQVQRTLGASARLLHRLDKEASGLVIFALREPASAPLQQAMDAGEIERRYVAIVDGELRGDGTIRLRIGRHRHDQRLRAALPESAPAGETACTHYRALGHGELSGRPVTAVELRLETGRTHQIRVHLAALGHPIVGDAAYGGSSFERLCLHAYALELPHPQSGKRLQLNTPLPESFARLVPRLTRPLT